MVIETTFNKCFLARILIFYGWKIHQLNQIKNVFGAEYTMKYSSSFPSGAGIYSQKLIHYVASHCPRSVSSQVCILEELCEKLQNHNKNKYSATVNTVAEYARYLTGSYLSVDEYSSVVKLPPPIAYSQPFSSVTLRACLA